MFLVFHFSVKLQKTHIWESRGQSRRTWGSSSVCSQTYWPTVVSL